MVARSLRKGKVPGSIPGISILLLFWMENRLELDDQDLLEIIHPIFIVIFIQETGKFQRNLFSFFYFYFSFSILLPIYCPLQSISNHSFFLLHSFNIRKTNFLKVILVISILLLDFFSKLFTKSANHLPPLDDKHIWKHNSQHNSKWMVFLFLHFPRLHSLVTF